MTEGKGQNPPSCNVTQKRNFRQGFGSRSALVFGSWSGSELEGKAGSGPGSHWSKKSGAVKAQNGAVQGSWTFTMEAWRLKMEPWRLCRPWWSQICASLWWGAGSGSGFAWKWTAVSGSELKRKSESRSALKCCKFATRILEEINLVPYWERSKERIVETLLIWWVVNPEWFIHDLIPKLA